jgi:hypothetical protein
MSDHATDRNGGLDRPSSAFGHIADISKGRQGWRSEKFFSIARKPARYSRIAPD